VVSFHAPDALPQGNSPQIPIEQVLWDAGAKIIIPASAGNRAPVVQPVAYSRHWSSYPSSFSISYDQK